MIDLPKGWAFTTLDSVAHWGSGGTPSRKNPEFFNGKIPWIKTGELGDKYVRTAEEFLSEEAVRKSSAKVFPKGSVGIAMYGATIGKASIWGIDASTNQACAVAQCTPEIISNEFLYYFLLSEKRGFINAGKGGAQPNISQGILKDWPIALPPLIEQKRIVAKIEELFSELDNGIESLKTARAQLKVYRQAVLKHAFEGKLTAAWREKNKDKLESADQLLKRTPAHRSKKLNAPTQAELEKFSELPSGWTYTRLGHFIDSIGAGKSFKCDEHEPTQNEIGVAKVSAVTWGEYDEHESKTCLDADKVNSEYFIKSGDFLFSRANTIELVGACVIAKTVTKRVMLSDKTLRIAFGDIDPFYFLYYLRSQSGRNEIMERSTGNQESMRNIGQDRIRNIIVPVCSPQEATRVAYEIQEKFSIIDNLEATIDAELQKSEALRQSILKKAFSGQLVAQDANDEPASALLARIRTEKATPTKKPKTKRRAA